jgi:hypothetical protein
MTLTTQNREYEFTQEPPKFTFVLSGVDSLECKIQPDLELVSKPSEVTVTDHIVGVINDFAFADSNSEVSTRLKIDGILSKLDNFVVKSEYSAKNENLVTFLNKNPAGIVFNNYNLAPEQLTFSSKIQNKSWYDTLTELSKNIGFEFWYDYNLNQCNLGSPDQIIVLTDENFDFEPDKFSPPTVVSYNQKTIYNRIIAKAGQLNAINLSEATNFNTNYPILESVDELGNRYSYIEDSQSIAKYGLRELFINSPSLNQSSAGPTISKESLANLLYQQAYRLILKHKEPQATITGLTATGPKDLVKIGNKLRITKKFPNHQRIVEGEYFVTRIEYSIDRESDTYQYNLTLMNYLDKQSVADNILNQFQRVDELPPNSLSESDTVNLTASTNGSITNGSYTTNSSFNLGVTQYQVSINATQTTTTLGSSFQATSIVIDSISIPIFVATNSNVLTGSATVDISALQSLTQTQKNQIYSNGNHNLSIVGSSDANVNISITISIVGYN